VTEGASCITLAQRLPDPKNTVDFHRLRRRARVDSQSRRGEGVKIFGDSFRSGAQIAAFEQFSDHADPPRALQAAHVQEAHRELNWSRRPAAAASLRATSAQGIGWNVQVAEWMDQCR